MVGEVCENDEKAGIYQKLDTVRITTSYSMIVILWINSLESAILTQLQHVLRNSELGL